MRLNFQRSQRCNARSFFFKQMQSFMLGKVWSSGIALYAMLCGRLPFKASGPLTVILFDVSRSFEPGEEHVRAEAMHPTWKDSPT